MKSYPPARLIKANEKKFDESNKKKKKYFECIFERFSFFHPELWVFFHIQLFFPFSFRILLIFRFEWNKISYEVQQQASA